MDEINIQNHHEHGNEKISLSVFENLINFSTSIPNSKLVNIAIENVNSNINLKYSEQIKQSSISPQKNTEDALGHKVIHSLVPENFMNMETTEPSFNKEELSDVDLIGNWGDISNNMKELYNLPTPPVPAKTTSKDDFKLLESEDETTLTPKYFYSNDNNVENLLELSVDSEVIISTTTAKGMEVDFSDIPNPIHITKATNYLRSHHLSTVTRSATVLANIVRPHIDVNDESIDDSSLIILNSTSPNLSNSSQMIDSSIKKDPHYLPRPKTSDSTESTNYSKSDFPNPSKNEMTTGVSDREGLHSKIKIFPSDKGVHNPKPNLSNTHSNLNSDISPEGSVVKSNKNTILVEGNSLGSSNNDFSSSIVISIGISCAFALLLFVILSLWLLKRNKNHSKVYLSYELAKPRTHIMRPMRPSLLPGETMIDNTTPNESEAPREPIYLDQEIKSNPTPLHSKYSISLESCDSGIDNLAFTDVSSNEGQIGQNLMKAHSLSRKKESGKARRPTPKYIARKKKLLIDSSIKVCSSDGSIFPASPSLTKCLIPPPPYSPSIKNDSKLNLSAFQPSDSFIKTPTINSISEGCDHLPSQSSTVK